jgi:hypothetical protein
MNEFKRKPYTFLLQIDLKDSSFQIFYHHCFLHDRDVQLEQCFMHHNELIDI